MEIETQISQPKTRLYFIDIARTIAILLMLEGHFIHDSLALQWADESYPVYATWKFIRGFTSPIFLTVTGLVFTYLMLGNERVSFFKNIRIKKGLKRVVELLFWGYLLQYYAFHVLQCIAIGIFSIILIYGIWRSMQFIPLFILYSLTGLGLFLTYLFFGQLGDIYWPKNAPIFIQNIFHGPYSLFPITPHMGYTMFGAAIGVLIFRNKEKVKSWKVIFGAFILGLSIYFGIKTFLVGLENIPGLHGLHLYRMDWILEKLGIVIVVLASLLWLETYVLKIKKENLFLKIGQNTLSIYIIHMMILYGSIIKYGINDYLHHKLGPWEIIPFTLGFWLLFIVFVYFIDDIRSKLHFILWPMKKYSSKLFGIELKDPVRP
jgi:uncharacterized membrane protein